MAKLSSHLDQAEVPCCLPEIVIVAYSLRDGLSPERFSGIGSGSGSCTVRGSGTDIVRQRSQENNECAVPRLVPRDRASVRVRRFTTPPVQVAGCSVRLVPTVRRILDAFRRLSTVRRLCAL